MAKICLDAGHGGKDSGAVGYGRLEKQDALKMVLTVAEMLKQKGHEVYLTRNTDIYESPYTKAMEANNAGADFFASFHRNSSANEQSNGYETLVYDNSDKAKICADYVNAEMERLGFRNRGTKVRTDLTVLNSTKMQAVLFEVGFISNVKDNDLFEEKFVGVCKVLTNGILKALGDETISNENTTGSVQVTPTPIPPVGKKELGFVDCTYQCYTDRWWNPVHNREDWGGKGDDHPMKYIGVCVSKGKIKGRVYTEKNGWLPYLTFADKYDINDLKNGVLGDGSNILGLELYYYTPEGYLYKEVHYRASVQGNKSFYAKQVDNKKNNKMDGYAGDLKRFLDKIQIWIE